MSKSVFTLKIPDVSHILFDPYAVTADCSAKVERAQGLDPESSLQTPIQLLSRSVIWSKCFPKPTTDFTVVALYFICNSVAVIVFWFV